MGVTGTFDVFLKMGFKPKEVQLQAFSGRTLAVDANVYLHEAIGVASREHKKKTLPHHVVEVFKRKIQLFLSFGIQVVLVFEPSSGFSLKARKHRKQTKTSIPPSFPEGEEVKSLVSSGALHRADPDIITELIQWENATSLVFVYSPGEADHQLKDLIDRYGCS